MRDVIRSNERLRLWATADGPLGQESSGVAVEWVGQAGHPSSYGLLGGRSSGTTRLVVPDSGSFEASLAGDADEVEFGLPEEFSAAVREGLRSPVELAVAAHGRVGSSERVFGRLAGLVSLLTIDGLPATDADLWTIWDSLAQGA